MISGVPVTGSGITRARRPKTSCSSGTVSTSAGGPSTSSVVTLMSGGSDAAAGFYLGKRSAASALRSTIAAPASESIRIM